MTEMISLSDLLDFVMKREETSATFFASMAERTGDSLLKTTFRNLKQRCEDRKSIIMKLKRSSPKGGKSGSIQIDPIRSYLVDVQPLSEISDRQGLAVGGLRAETSEKLYAGIAVLVSEPHLREIFDQLHVDHRLNGQLCNCLYDQRIEREIH